MRARKSGISLDSVHNVWRLPIVQPCHDNKAPAGSLLTKAVAAKVISKALLLNLPKRVNATSAPSRRISSPSQVLIAEEFKVLRLAQA